MSRDLTSNLNDETSAAGLTPVLIALLDFQGGAVRVWSGIGTLSWDSLSWVGLGHLGTISPIEESTDVKANGVVLQLSGVPSSLIATVLGDNYQGRDVKVWLGALDAAGAVVADPYLMFSGRMETVEIDDGVETAAIRVAAESRLADLQRSRERRYTHEDQQIDFPGDLGLQYMPTAQSTPFLWGGQRVPAYAGDTSGSDDVEVEG